MPKAEKRKFTVREARPATRQISGELSDFSARIYFSDGAGDPPDAPHVEFVSMPDGSTRTDLLVDSVLSVPERDQLLGLLDKLLTGAFGG